MKNRTLIKTKKFNIINKLPVNKSYDYIYNKSFSQHHLIFHTGNNNFPLFLLTLLLLFTFILLLLLLNLNFYLGSSNILILLIFGKSVYNNNLLFCMIYFIYFSYYNFFMFIFYNMLLWWWSDMFSLLNWLFKFILLCWLFWFNDDCEKYLVRFLLLLNCIYGLFILLVNILLCFVNELVEVVWCCCVDINCSLLNFNLLDSYCY